MSARRDDAIFDSLAYSYAIPDAIRDGWLVPIRQRAVRIPGLDLSAVRSRVGDLRTDELEAAVLPHVRATVRALVPLAAGRRTMVFTAGVRHAHAIAAEICDVVGSPIARAVDGETDSDERHAAVAAFAGGGISHLVNCAIFTEGFDLPAIDLVAVLRPTESVGLYTQMIGRGTRPLDGLVDGLPTADARRAAIAASAKPDVIVLDFQGNAGRHALVSVADILGADAQPKTRDRARQILAREPGSDVLAVLERAALELAREEESLARRRGLARRAPGSTYTVEDVSPFASVETILGVRIPRRTPRVPQATAPQRALLGRLGVPYRDDIQLHQAKALLDAALARAKRGLCSVRTAEILAQHGYRSDLTREQAREVIAAINAGAPPVEPGTTPYAAPADAPRPSWCDCCGAPDARADSGRASCTRCVGCEPHRGIRARTCAVREKLVARSNVSATGGVRG